MGMGFATVTGLTSNFWHQGSFADPFVSEKIWFSKSSLGREYSLRAFRHFEENKNWVKSSPKTWTGPKLNISWSLKSLECLPPPPPHYFSFSRSSAFPGSVQDVSCVLPVFCTKEGQYLCGIFWPAYKKKILVKLKMELVLVKILHNSLQKPKCSGSILAIIAIVFNLRKLFTTISLPLLCQL